MTIGAGNSKSEPVLLPVPPALIIVVFTSVDGDTYTSNSVETLKEKLQNSLDE